MIRKFRYDQNVGKMVEVSTKRPERKSPHIMPDIEPYQTVGPDYGRWITSRSQHRQYLRDYGLTEVGNERKAFGLPDKE